MNYKIFNEDCLEGMKKIADGSVDMILTDLPFGITAAPFDIKLDLQAMWKEINRVTKKNAAVVFFAVGKFLIELAMSNFENYRYEICWEKSVPVGFFNANKMPLRCHENICLFYRALPTFNPQWRSGKSYARKSVAHLYKNYGEVKEKFASVNDGEHYYPRDVIYFKSTVGQVERVHPQQKPVDLLEYLIRTYSNEGETVLDATMGSGSTGVACVNTNRNFIGFELEENFFNITQKRIAEAVAKREQSLF